MTRTMPTYKVLRDAAREFSAWKEEHRTMQCWPPGYESTWECDCVARLASIFEPVIGARRRWVTGASSNRLWGKVGNTEHINECWPWLGTGHTGANDIQYGIVRRDSKRMYAHKAVWEAQNGPLLLGVQLKRSCKTKVRCVNPAHWQQVYPDKVGEYVAPAPKAQLSTIGGESYVPPEPPDPERVTPLRYCQRGHIVGELASTTPKTACRTCASARHRAYVQRQKLSTRLSTELQARLIELQRTLKEVRP